MLEIEKHLHSFARAWFDAHPFKPDKKMFRWNDIVAVGIHYMNCGDDRDLAIGEAGCIEAIEACNPENKLMYVVGRGPLTMIQKWMEQ